MKRGGSRVPGVQSVLGSHGCGHSPGVADPPDPLHRWRTRHCGESGDSLPGWRTQAGGSRGAGSPQLPPPPATPGKSQHCTGRERQRERMPIHPHVSMMESQGAEMQGGWAQTPPVQESPHNKTQRHIATMKEKKTRGTGSTREWANLESCSRERKSCLIDSIVVWSPAGSHNLKM